jgi:hypothetical protein
MHEALDYVKAATPAAVGSSAEPPGVPTQVAPILLSPPANGNVSEFKNVASVDTPVPLSLYVCVCVCRWYISLSLSHSLTHSL